MTPPVAGQPEDRPYRGIYLVGLLMIGAVGVRAVLHYQGQARLAALLLIAAYSVLYLAEPRLAVHHFWFRRIYYPAQAGLLLAACAVQPFLDMIVVLYLPLAPQVTRSFTRRAASAWVILFAVLLTIPLVIDMGWAPGLALALTNVAAGIFMLSYDQLYLQVHTGQIESQALLAELQQAHLELQAYVAQAEELAAARERNRLTRELHDSVSQVMFSVTLTVQAARQLLDLDRPRAAQQIDRLQEMTADALKQLRSLIAQLHPQPDSPSVAGPTTANRLPPAAA